MKRSAQTNGCATATVKPPPLPVLYSAVPDMIEQRDSRILLVWGDVPYWQVVDAEMFEFLDILIKGSTLRHAARKLAYARGHTICSTIERIKKKMTPLVEAGVIYGRYARKAKPASQNALENITVNITRRCNLNCRFCYNRGFHVPAGELPVAKITRFLNQAIPVMSENRKLTILGGEPTLRGFESIAIGKWAVENGFETTISTNGLLVDTDFASAAAKCGIKIQVSIDGPTAFEHEMLRGRGSFEKAKKAVALLVKSGVKVVTNMVVHEDTQWRLEDFFKFSKKLGVSGVRFVPLRRIGGGSSLRPPDRLKLLRSVRTFFLLNPRYRTIANEDWFSTLASTCKLNRKKTYCGAGTNTLLVDADGSVYPCTGQTLPEFKLGSVDVPFRKIWVDSLLLSGLRKRFNVDNINKKCSECLVRYWCSAGCRGEAYSRTGSCFEPSPACEETRKVITEMFWVLSETSKFTWEKPSPCSGK